jgi:hypothetical protein
VTTPLSALVVVALGIGGPPAPPGSPPVPLRDATITVARRGAVVARSGDGELRARLRPGVYTIAASLPSEGGSPPRSCAVKTVRLTRSRTARRVALGCPLK